MRRNTQVAVECVFSKGVFSTERAFEVILANGETHSGPAPLHYCWKRSGEPLGKSDAVATDLPGLLAARLVDSEVPDGFFAVEVPDGEVLAVSRGAVHDRPKAPTEDAVPA